MRNPILVLIFLALIINPAMAALPQKASKMQNHSIKKQAHHSRVQQHYSFLPPPRPIKSVEKLKATAQNSIGEVKLQTPPSNQPSMPSVSSAQSLLPTKITHKQPIDMVYAKKKNSFPARLREKLSIAQSTFAERMKQPRLRVRSNVTKLSQSDANTISTNLANLLEAHYPASDTHFVFAPANRNLFTPILEQTLREKGFAIMQATGRTPESIVLEYHISRLDKGLVAQIKTQNLEASGYLAPEDKANMPFSITLKE